MTFWDFANAHPYIALLIVATVCFWGAMAVAQLAGSGPKLPKPPPPVK